MSERPPKVRLGTRGSALALRQAHMVLEALARLGHIAAEIVVVRTAGDDIAAGPRWRDDTPGLFTTEIEQALDRRDVDVAVHSLKDLPTVVWSGTVIAAVLERANPSDALVSVGHLPLRALPPHARVGTSSLRRRAQLLAARPDLVIEDLRGNVPTRLGRVAPGDLDAIVLAVAGLERLGRGDAISEVLPLDTFVPAPGQAAIAVQAREQDAEVVRLVQGISHTPTTWAVDAERVCLAAIEGGCQAPVGAYARIEQEGRMTIDAFVSNLTGTRVVRAREESMCTSIDQACALGRHAAVRLIEQGGGELWRS
jgi:hydroxymethylbilane synthase